MFVEPLPSNDKGNTHTDTLQDDLVSLLPFFKTGKVDLKGVPSNGADSKAITLIRPHIPQHGVASTMASPDLSDSHVPPSQAVAPLII
jgi:hypothetical protein